MRRKIGPSVANQPDRPAAAGDPSPEAPSWCGMSGTIRAEHEGEALREYFRRYATSDSDVAAAELIVRNWSPTSNVTRAARRRGRNGAAS